MAALLALSVLLAAVSLPLLSTVMDTEVLELTPAAVRDERRSLPMVTTAALSGLILTFPEYAGTP